MYERCDFYDRYSSDNSPSCVRTGCNCSIPYESIIMQVNRIESSTLADRPSIKLFDENRLIGEGRTANFIAHMIKAHGGPADSIKGFLTTKQHEILWKEVCDLV